MSRMSKVRSPEDAFYDYLLEHPEVKIIIKSPLMIGMIDILEKQASSIEEIHSRFFQIDVPDLIEVLDVLVGIHFVRQDRLAGKEAYFLTDKGREFRQKYLQAKKVFGVLGD